MILLDGKEYAQEQYHILQGRIDKLDIKPKLVIFLIGNKSDSLLYTNMKMKKCKKLGLEAERIIYPCDSYENITNLELTKLVKEIQDNIHQYNMDRTVHGIMVQLPLPKPLKNYTQEILDCIISNKDVDGLTSQSLGLLSIGKPKFVSSTPKGALSLVDRYRIPIKGKNVTIIGNSPLVGIPLTLLLTQKGATVTMCHIDTIDTRKHCLRADIIFSCCGVGHLIKNNWVKEGAAVIDIGITVRESPFSKNKIVIGDCDFMSVKDKVKYITPVPGGIGPMTIYTLIEQLVESAER